MTAAAFTGYIAQYTQAGMQIRPVGMISSGAALIGKTPVEALRLAPLLNALCPQAHSIALARALEQGASAAQQEAQREQQLLLEAGATAALRFGLAWPQALGLPALGEAVRDARRAALESRADGVADALEATLQSGVSAAASEAARGAGLPLSIQQRFISLDRRARALAGRLRAGRIPARFPPRTVTGWADTLRGRLHIRVTLQDGRIATCRATTPTQRLLRPRGSLTRALADLAPGPDRLRQAALCVMAFDPCLPVHLAEAQLHA